MNSKELGADYVYAWPSAQLGVMGAPQAVDLVRDRTGHHEGNRQPAARGHGARLSDARL